MEAYLGEVEETDVSLDYGTSELFTEEELSEAMIRIKCQFASRKGWLLHSLKYAGDECCSQENLEWLNSIKEGKTYVKAIELLSEFHVPEEGFGALEAGADYKDYQWWLGCDEKGDWDIVSFGY